MTRAKQINDRLGHKYTTCQDGCINESCKNCRVTGRHKHSDGSTLRRY